LLGEFRLITIGFGLDIFGFIGLGVLKFGFIIGFTGVGFKLDLAFLALFVT
jgi:hypothetical protein